MTYNGERFAKRHIGPSSSDEQEMLALLGYRDIETFISDVVPANIQIAKKLSHTLDSAKSEVEVIAELINHNLEREEKERLLKAKVMELKEIFKSSSLDELKGLKINLEHDDMDDVDHWLRDEQEAEV